MDSYVPKYKKYYINQYNFKISYIYRNQFSILFLLFLFLYIINEIHSAITKRYIFVICIIFE